MKKLGFGFMRLPHKEDYNEVDFATLLPMVDSFMAGGFTYFDTAWMYHGGKSEEAIREAVVKRYPRDSFVLASKMPVAMMQSKEEHASIFATQLERCGVEYFDNYLIHNLGAENYKKAEEFGTFAFIAGQKAAGKIKRIGFSYHDNAALLDEILTAHPETEFVQLQINYLDWDSAGIQSGECYRVARKHNKPIIVMEPLKGGMLAEVPAEAEQVLRAARPDMSIPSWGIRFAASLEGVETVLSGMGSPAQLADNMGYMAHFEPLAEAERAAVKRAADIIQASIAIPCTGCRYCVDECPRHIAIPEYFSMYNNDRLAPGNGFSVASVYYSNLSQTRGKAGDCIACGACERHCPQQLAIIHSLKDVAERFETPETA